ncbi:hypothetical protein [Shewanella colwelliana]|uniref:hypothetical protein n=1 Tax=Shewanella colwelliana TaxID=23 RepID=UPI0022AFF28E|nr:hypothetical protein [Shewanella colwelliana]MCZ4337664.1 hypothetical protein [Shewanella colwelliana]
MSDRTAVYLTLRQADFERHAELFEYRDEEETLPNALIKLSFFDVNPDMPEVKSPLHNHFIPHDWEIEANSYMEGGIERLRILADGSRQLTISDSLDGHVNLEEVIAAYELNELKNFIETKKQQQAISWEDQEIIMQARADAEAYLNGLSDADFNAVVTQTIVEPSRATREQATRYLIDTSYLPDCITRHIVEAFSLKMPPAQDAATFEFKLIDESASVEDDVIGRVDNTMGLGLRVEFDGYGNPDADNRYLVCFEKLDNDLRAIVYADVNTDEPTHIISFTGAKSDALSAE